MKVIFESKEPIAKTTAAKMYPINNGIIYFKALPIKVLTMDLAKEAMEMINEVCDDEKPTVLFEISQVASMSKEVRAYIKDYISNYLLCVAGASNSVFGTLIGNFFLGVNKPLTPIKLFRSSEDALEWLSETKEKLTGK